jgi:hypothetical protein
MLPRKIPGTHFCQKLGRLPPLCGWKSIGKSNDSLVGKIYIQLCEHPVEIRTESSALGDPYKHFNVELCILITNTNTYIRNPRETCI